MTEQEENIYDRSKLLLGRERIERIREMRVIIFGVGGVGSWCAESLLRTGVIHLTLVDSDCVCITNCNRQLMATTQTVGEVKVCAMRRRLLEINPNADIVAMEKVYCAENAYEFELEKYDFIIDAIDSLRDKADLILRATSLSKRTVLLSSMGAALRIDPTKVRVAEFWDVKGDPLARAIRNKFKREKTFPKRKFMCVYSEEMPLPNLGVDSHNGSYVEKVGSTQKVQTNGSLSHITGIFGMTLAGLVISNHNFN